MARLRYVASQPGLCRSTGPAPCRSRPSPLVDRDVSRRVVLQMLRHAQVDVAVEVDASVSSTVTRQAFKRVG
jgi:hypothetical protein